MIEKLIYFDYLEKVHIFMSINYFDFSSDFKSFLKKSIYSWYYWNYFHD